MKMANGGFSPAYNVQFATDTKSQVIVGVDVITVGSDQGQMEPMVQQIEERHGKVPEEYLVDGGFAKHEDIEAVSAAEIGARCTRRCRSRRTPRWTPMPPTPATARRWRSGGNGWAPSRPRRSTRIGRRRPNVSMRWRVSVGWCSWWCVGWRRCGRSRCGTRWPTMCCGW